MKKIFTLLTLLVTMMGSSTCYAQEVKEADYYKLKMMELVQELKSIAVSVNPNFGLILNGGINIYVADKYVQDGEAKVNNFLQSVDGVLLEGLNFGYEFKDDKKTPDKVRKDIFTRLALPIQRGVPVFNIDYCENLRNRSMATIMARKDKVVNFSSDRNLTSISISELNPNDVNSLAEVKSFIAVFNPQKYDVKGMYLSALQRSNYDLLIIDAFYHGELLTAEDIAKLKVKPNGKRRLVYSYMSTGEAEDYRYYWKPEYKKNPPTWLAAANKNWEGNYKVEYWRDEWKDILFRGQESYLNKLLACGYDGAFLDVIDSFYYFEALEE